MTEQTPNLTPDPTFLQRKAVKVAAGAAVMAAAFGGAYETGQHLTGHESEQAAVIVTPPTSEAPTTAPVETTPAAPAPVETKKAAPSPTATEVAAPKATHVYVSPKPAVTHAEAKPSPAQTGESMTQIMDHLRNRKVGDKIPTLNLGEGKLLVYGGKIYTEPSTSAEQTNYLQGTRMQDVEVVTINDKPWACGGVSNPNDVRCVPLENNPDLAVYDSATDTTTKFTPGEQLPITYLTVAKVGEDGFGYAATATGFEGIAYNPPQA